MNCLKFCCCCCFSKEDVAKQYPHVEYQAMTRFNTPPQPKLLAEVPEFHQVPMKKIFELPQHQTEYGAKPDFAADEVITQQPVLKQVGHMSHRSVSQSTEDSSSAISHFKPSPLGMNFESRIYSSSSSDIDSEHAHGSWMPSDLETKTSTMLNEETKLGPRLTFSLYYDIQRCVLTLTLFEASNLPVKDRRGTSDPFVVMYLNPSREEIFQSKVVYKTLNPCFKEHFEFKNVLPDDIRCQTIMFKVYTKNDFIGTSTLPLKEADLYGATTTTAIDEKAQETGV